MCGSGRPPPHARTHTYTHVHTLSLPHSPLTALVPFLPMTCSPDSPISPSQETGSLWLVTQPTPPTPTLAPCPLPPHLHPTSKSHWCYLESANNPANSGLPQGCHPSPGPSHLAPGPRPWPQGPSGLCRDPASPCLHQRSHSVFFKHKSDSFLGSKPLRSSHLTGASSLGLACYTPALRPPWNTRCPRGQLPRHPQESLTIHLGQHMPQAALPSQPYHHPAPYLPLGCRTQTFCAQIYFLLILFFLKILFIYS